MDNLTYYVIIVAGGSGKRMNSSLPKQFLNLAGKPIIMHTLEKFNQSKYNPNIILVLSPDDITTWNQKIAEHHFQIPHQIVTGGAERFFSVKNGFASITKPNSIIAVHDAVRPLVSIKTIDNCFENAAVNGNAIAAIGSKDSVRVMNGIKNYSIARDQVYLVQTPQTFSYKQLYDSYQQDFSKDFTDDASVVEKYGNKIFLEKGDLFNIKITYQEDLVIAEALISQK